MLYNFATALVMPRLGVQRMSPQTAYTATIASLARVVRIFFEHPSAQGLPYQFRHLQVVADASRALDDAVRDSGDSHGSELP
jgi:site-specific recombinase